MCRQRAAACLASEQAQVGRLCSPLACPLTADLAHFSSCWALIAIVRRGRQGLPRAAHEGGQTL
jgi:hypothetical protein